MCAHMCVNVGVCAPGYVRGGQSTAFRKQSSPCLRQVSLLLHKTLEHLETILSQSPNHHRHTSDNRCVLLHVAFSWILEIPTQVARLEWQAACPLSYHLCLGSDLQKHQVAGRLPTPPPPPRLFLLLLWLVVCSTCEELMHHSYIVSISLRSAYILRTLTHV